MLKIETHPVLLSVLAAGLLEDVIDMRVIDRIEREAAADPRFLALLHGVWYSRKPDDVKARLDAILGPGSSDREQRHSRLMISRRRFLQWLASLGIVGAAASAYAVASSRCCARASRATT